MMQLLSESAKTDKAEAIGAINRILYLAPHRLGADGANICPWSSAGCRASCLYTAGRGVMPSVESARFARRAWFMRDQDGFLSALEAEVRALVTTAARKGMVPALRLNGTSDIDWRTIAFRGVGFADYLHDTYPTLAMYEYTKDPRRASESPDWYPQAYSLSERRTATALALLARGARIAVVFAGRTLPDTWQGKPVIDGDVHDLIGWHPRGTVLGLRAKGAAKRDTTGFAVAA